jgi:hypothetical protein
MIQPIGEPPGRCLNYLHGTIANSNGGLYDANEISYYRESTNSQMD